MKRDRIVCQAVVFSSVAIAMAGCRSAPPAAETTEVTPAPAAIEQQIEAPAITLDEPKPAAMPEKKESAPAPKDDFVTYKVQSGDSLSYIAARFGIHVAEITEINPIDNPSKIRVGQTIKLPPHAKDKGARAVARAKPKAPKTAAVGSATGTPPALGSDGKYLIQNGDSLDKIAKKFGVTVAALKEANGMTSDRIGAGKTLVIPGTVTFAPTAPAMDIPAMPAAPVAPAYPVTSVDTSALPAIPPMPPMPQTPPALPGLPAEAAPTAPAAPVAPVLDTGAALNADMPPAMELAPAAPAAPAAPNATM